MLENIEKIMEQNKERNSNARSSPKPSKSSTIFSSLWPKRSTKVEPHPACANVSCSVGRNKQGGEAGSSCRPDLSFARCSPEKRHQSESNNSNKNMRSNQHSIAKAFNNNSEQINTINTVNRRIKNHRPFRNKPKTTRLSSDGSMSDGADMGKSVSRKHRSPNHNRFSHQFSLCCKADRRHMTPPVSVRYKSVPESVNVLRCRENLSLNISSMLTNSAPARTDSITTSSISQEQGIIGECSSAPETPVNGKNDFLGNNSHSSPSNCSVKSSQSDAGGQPRSIAMTACRSRLRLKLMPPGKEIDSQLNKSPLKDVTPQHMSSPNISTQPEIIIEQFETGTRSMSHENIQIPNDQRTQYDQQPQDGTGLARQALMAAQVLSLIPTSQARERSYLDGRLGSSSLLGPSELSRVLPQKEVTIFVGTWNMNGQSPPKQMNDFVLPAAVEHVPDIVAIGTQESSPDRFEWEVTLQETLGPSHVLFHSTSLGTLHLAVYMRRDLIWFCSAPEDGSMSVRPGTAFRTKGAIAISFCLFGTSMLFVTSHLTAHQQKVKERVQDVKRIIHALDLPKNLNLRHKNKDVTQNFDIVFWCGDLNFRLSEPREKLLEWIENTKFPLPLHLPHGYMHTDQLSSVLADGAAFRGFMEANITFPPTYKYDPGTQQFDTSSKQRAPAYTDRILFKFRQAQGLAMRRTSSMPPQSAAYIKCLSYDSVPSIISSDHKPVWALFKTAVRAGTDAIPLAAGLFCRDIYIEGMKRRLNNQYSGSSAVCAIQ